MLGRDGSGGAESDPAVQHSTATRRRDPRGFVAWACSPAASAPAPAPSSPPSSPPSPSLSRAPPSPPPPARVAPPSDPIPPTLPPRGGAVGPLGEGAGPAGGAGAGALASSASVARNPRDPSSPEFVRGALAATFNVLVTFPANKLIFRQQSEGMSTRGAFWSMHHEGLQHLYRGIGPPLLQRTLAMSVMFGLYDWYSKKLQMLGWSAGSGPLSVAAALLAGSTEAILGPLERLQTILQHRHYTTHYENMWDAALKLRHFGLREYYRGASAILLRNGPANALFFTLREPIRDLLPASDRAGAAWALARDFFSGAVLGASISTLFYPIHVAKSVMQSQIGGPFPSIVTTLRRVHEERRGVQGIFRGVHVNFSRSLVSWGITNSVYEFLRRNNFPRDDR